MPWGTRDERYRCSGGAKVGLGAACTAVGGAEGAAGAAVAAAPVGVAGAEVPAGPAGDPDAEADGEEDSVDMDVMVGLFGEVQPAAAKTAAARSTIPRDFERPLYMGFFLSRAVLI